MTDQKIIDSAVEHFRQLLISQISAVSDQYAQTLGCGGYTEELYQEYIAKLEAAAE